jgi:hypothetical protein
VAAVTDRRVALLMFAGLMVVYTSSRVRVQTDSIWTIPTAASIALRHDTNLDEYQPAFARVSHGVRPVGAHFYYDYPLGAVLIAVPVVFLTDLVAEAGRALGLGLGLKRWYASLHATADADPGFWNRTEQLIASPLVGIAALLVFFTARRFVSQRGALGVALLFGLGTSAYSTASRVLWQHAPSVALIAWAVWLLTRPGGQTVRSAALCGLAVALCYVCRPTNALTVAGVTIYFALRERRCLVPYLAAAACVAGPFCAYNLSTYGTLLSPYYTNALFIGDNVALAALGQLVSPSRGLLVFSPFLVFSGIGFAAKARARSLTAIDVLFAVLIVVHWAVISTWAIWWAGHCVGPRFFTDVLPYLMWFAAKPIASVADAPRQRRALTATLAVTGLLSIAIHTAGAMSPRVHGWNDGPPDNVDRMPSRVWDWKDPQVLRAFY